MFRTLTLAAVVTAAFLSPVGAQTAMTLFKGKLEVVIPENYRPFEPSENANDKYRFARWFARDGVDVSKQDPPYVTIRLVTLISVKDHDDLAALDHKYQYWIDVPEGAGSQDVHQQICDGRTKLWSHMPGWRGLGFQLFDANSGIGRCINIGGGFSIFTRKIGDLLVSVETANRSAFLALARKSKLKNDDIAEMTSVEKWKFFRPATNAETAESILKSARSLP